MADPKIMEELTRLRTEVEAASDREERRTAALETIATALSRLAFHQHCDCNDTETPF